MCVIQNLLFLLSMDDPSSRLYDNLTASDEVGRLGFKAPLSSKSNLKHMIFSVSKGEI